MGFRFRKSFKAGPFRVNLSKSGVGCSFGVPGFRYTLLANGRTRRTLSIPGTGLSYVDESGSRKRSSSQYTQESNYDNLNYQNNDIFINIPNNGIRNEFIDNINNCRNKDKYYKVILGIETILTVITGNFPLFVLIILTIIARFLCKDFFILDKEYTEEINAIALSERYKILNLILYIISLSKRVVFVDNENEYSYQSYVNTVRIYPKSLRYIKLDIIPYVLEISNYKFYFLPNTILVDDGRYFSNIDYRGLECNFDIVEHISEDVPEDTMVVGSVWKHQNKNGEPDRRYTNNYEIPICAFCEIKCNNKNGFDVILQLSNAKIITNLIGLYNVLSDDECFTNSEKLEVVKQMISALVNGQCCPICGDDKIEKFNCLHCGHKVKKYYTYCELTEDKSDSRPPIVSTILIIALLCFSMSIHSSYTPITQKNDNTQSINNVNTQEKEETSEQINTVDTNSSEYYYKTFINPMESKFIGNANKNAYNDKNFYDIQKKYANVISKMNENEVKINDNDYASDNWTSIIESEGMPYFEPNWQYIKRVYSKYLSPTYNQWLSHLQKTRNIVDDACLIVSPDELRTYIIELENLIDKNPNFIALDDMQEQLKWYLRIYLAGLDNSPIFDVWETKNIDSDFKSSYEKFLSLNKDSKFYPMVEELYNKVAQQDFKWSEELHDWQLGPFYEKYLNN